MEYFKSRHTPTHMRWQYAPKRLANKSTEEEEDKHSSGAAEKHVGTLMNVMLLTVSDNQCLFKRYYIHVKLILNNITGVSTRGCRIYKVCGFF